MSIAWQLRIFEQHKLVCSINVTDAVELGRQQTAEEAVYSHRPVQDRRRVVIADKDEKTISRRHALLAPRPEGGFRVENLSKEQPILLAGGREILPGSTGLATADETLRVGSKMIRLHRADDPGLAVRTLGSTTAPPGRFNVSAASLSLLPRAAATGSEIKQLISWLQAAMDVMQSAASSADFFEKAARAMVELVNLESGRVLLLSRDRWETRALYTAPRIGEQVPRLRAGLVGEAPAPRAASDFSTQILNRVRLEKRTFWDGPDALPVAASLVEVQAVVAAPILDRRGEVIGALYGDRKQQSTSPRPGGGTGVPPVCPPDDSITEAEAMLVELLARGVAAGLARVEQEQAALAARVRFEQFVTPEVAVQLAENPDLLKGRDAEVSLLFCDIRGFSRVSERVGPARTVEWVSDVMEALSDCVLAQEGVLVDYIGDELIAMWGAPREQPEHARRACRAALAMLDQLPRLNERWQSVLGEETYVGIGINSGIAQVGNTGSRHKFKYGPLGNTVNLASRVQGATRYLKCRCLITGATQAQLDDTFLARRLCRARVVNIREPVPLYEVARPGTPGWPQAKVEYEKALTEFEAGRYSTAASILGNWRAQHPDDAPALLLLNRAVQCMVEEPASFDSVWVLPGK